MPPRKKTVTYMSDVDVIPSPSTNEQNAPQTIASPEPPPRPRKGQRATTIAPMELQRVRRRMINDKNRLNSPGCNEGQTSMLEQRNLDSAFEAADRLVLQWPEDNYISSNIEAPQCPVLPSLDIRNIPSNFQDNEGIPNENIDHEVSQSVPSSGRKGRGSAINYTRADKIKITTNEFMQSVGETDSAFTSLLGCIVRTPERAPLDVVDWKHMPQVYLDNIWEEIMLKTDASHQFKEPCLKKAGILWRKWKNRVKKTYFDPFKYDHEKLSTPPTNDHISSYQWPNLVAYWQREDIAGQAEKNRENRSKLLYVHHKGRKSFARVREERAAQNLPNDRLSVLLDVITTSDGRVPDERSQEVVSKVNEELEKLPEAEQTAENREMIFTNIFGKEKYGRVRTLGTGVTPTQVFGSSSSRSNTSTFVEMQKMKEQVEYLVKQNEETTMELQQSKKEHQELQQRQKQFEAMFSFMQSYLLSQGVEVPSFNVGSTSHSGQIPTGGSGHYDNVTNVRECDSNGEDELDES